MRGIELPVSGASEDQAAGFQECEREGRAAGRGLDPARVKIPINFPSQLWDSVSFILLMNSVSYPQKDMDTNVYSSFVQNRPKLEATQMSSIPKWINKLYRSPTMKYYTAMEKVQLLI